MLQNLFFLSGCMGGMIVFVWSMMTERQRELESRKRLREDFSRTLQN